MARTLQRWHLMASSRGLLRSQKHCPRALSAQKAIPCLHQSSRALTSATGSGSDSDSKPVWLDALPDNFNLLYAADRKQEVYLRKTQNRSPIGSRRLRQAIATNQGISFEQLPYRCFQEARTVLAAHRQGILARIALIQARIDRLSRKTAETEAEQTSKRSSLPLMKMELSNLIIEADTHDPQVKRRFENGLGDMDKPIYRHLADQKWRKYNRQLIMQRITQMHVTPDVLDHINPTASVDLSFSRVKIQPGQFVESLRSQFPPSLNIQVFDAGRRLVTVVAVDSDVPDFQNDKFFHRCHGIYTNIEISPTSPRISLTEHQDKSQRTAVPWLPPYAYNGSSYHRLSIWVLQHKDNQPLDPNQLAIWSQRDHFSLRKFTQQTRAKPIGVTMFRTQWDDGMLQLMKKYNISGSDIQMKRAAPVKGPYKKRDTRRMRG